MKEYLNKLSFEKIYLVDNPSIFEHIFGNRPVNDKSKIAQIKEAMKEGRWLPPIIISSDMLCCDGQHRWRAFKELIDEGFDVKLRVILVNVPNPLRFAIELNSNQKRWINEDYLRAYVAENLESYVLLNKFIEKHNRFKGQLKAAVQLLTETYNAEQFKNGLISITIDSVLNAEEIIKELEEFSKMFNSNIFFKRDVILGWVNARKKISETMSFSEYLDMFKQFSFPEKDSQVVWMEHYLKVTLKT